jgi:uncharacterized protein YbjT (DUF2867 family)
MVVRLTHPLWSAARRFVSRSVAGMNPTHSRSTRHVVVTGGTGYLGRALVPQLLARGHWVRLLVRAGSERKAPAGAEIFSGNALDPVSVGAALRDCDTLVHLVGVPKPSPAKARQFRAIDLVSIHASVAAVAQLSSAIRPHLVYLSVAQPAPVMRDYIAVRAEGEALIRAHTLDATCLRPWYVLGPGHRWPMILLPVYAVLRRLPATRVSAERLGFVTLAEMVAALVRAIEEPAHGVRIVDVPAIKRAATES